MTKLLDLLSATTEDFEKRNASGEEYSNNGYSNRIRLRDESYVNTLENLANHVISSKSTESAEISTDDVSLSYTFKEIGREVENISLGKAIRLNSEKLKNLENRIGISTEIQEQENTMGDVTDKTIGDMENTEISEKVELTGSIVSDIPEENEAVVENVPSAIGDFGATNITSSQIDEVYQQIMEETQETLKAKEDAAKAEADVVEAEKLAKQRIEESEQKVLEKSTEQAEIQAKRAAAIARRTEVENAIIAAIGTQRNTLGIAKHKYIEQQQNARLKIQELNEQAESKTRENDKKIIDFQKIIDEGISDLTQVENEIAKKEAILAALNTSIDGVSNFANSDVQESVYQKVA